MQPYGLALGHSSSLPPHHQYHSPCQFQTRLRLRPYWQRQGAPRDVLLLDIALDAFFRLRVEQMDKGTMSGGARGAVWACLVVVMGGGRCAHLPKPPKRRRPGGAGGPGAGERFGRWQQQGAGPVRCSLADGGLCYGVLWVCVSGVRW